MDGQLEEINIGGYRYIVGYTDASADTDPMSLGFVMLRDFTIVNDVARDLDIMFIEESLYEEYAASLTDESHAASGFAFPVPGRAEGGYSTDFTDFTEMTSVEGLATGRDVYRLYACPTGHDTPAERKVRCNRIRIYHPAVRQGFHDMVVDVHNHINGIHFHYLTRPLKCLTKGASTEFRDSMEVYSEYAEALVPNIDDLFRTEKDGSYRTWYAEDLNGSEVSGLDTVVTGTDGTQYVPLNMLTQPSRLKDDGQGGHIREFVPEALTIENNYLTYPFNVTMWPYTGTDGMMNTYTQDTDASPVTVTFLRPVRFSLASRTGFSGGRVTLVSEFMYPERDLFEAKFPRSAGMLPVREAYKYYNNVTEKDYDSYYLNRYRQLHPEDHWMTDTDVLELIASDESVQDELDDEEYTEEHRVPIDFLGFKVMLASDTGFRNIIYETNTAMRLSGLDDFGFRLNDIFRSWDEVPDCLCARVNFIDRYLGTCVAGNTVMLTRDDIKYMVSSGAGIYRLDSVTDMNSEMKEFDLKDGALFLTGVTCAVKDAGTEAAQTVTRQSPRLLYRPVFYRTQDLQHVRLRAGVTQNIGVAMADYMTKVDTFKLTLNGTEYIETARNGIYVLFRVDASSLTASLSGAYNVTDQDGEYISSGTWSVY